MTRADHVNSSARLKKNCERFPSPPRGSMDLLYMHYGAVWLLLNVESYLVKWANRVHNIYFVFLRLVLANSLLSASIASFCFLFSASINSCWTRLLFMQKWTCHNWVMMAHMYLHVTYSRIRFAPIFVQFDGIFIHGLEHASVTRTHPPFALINDALG